MTTEIINLISPSNLTAVRSDLMGFISQQPKDTASTRPWTTPQGRLTVAERQARIDILQKHTPAAVLNLCQAKKISLELFVEASFDQNREQFFAANWMPEVVVDLAAPPPPAQSQNGNAWKISLKDFVAAEPKGAYGWRTPQGWLTTAEQAARLLLLQHNTPDMVSAMLRSFNVDLATFVDSTRDLDRQQFVDRFFSETVEPPAKQSPAA